jgi:hypothetical protein
MSFNNKHIILETWNDIRKSLDDIINDENQSFLEENNNFNDEENIDIIIHKNKTFILENNKLYNFNNKYNLGDKIDINDKGSLYGEYINGKVVISIL